MISFKYSIKTKIFLIILVPALILLSVVYLDYMNLSSLGRSAELILSKNYRSIKAAHQVKQYLEKNQNLILGALFFENQEIPAALPSGGRILSLLETCKNNITETGEEEIMDRLLRQYGEYHQLYSNLSDIAGQNGRDRDLYYGFVSLTTSLNHELDSLISLNESAMEIADQRTQEIASEALTYSMGLIIFSILFTLIFSSVFSFKISRPLIELARGISKIREGSGQYPHFSIISSDEIGFLTFEFNQLLERLKIYDQLSADKLMAERLRAYQAEETKSRLIADLSHQLKTPMTSLSMSVNLLASKSGESMDERQKRLMDMAQEDCTRLSALINELLDIAKLEVMLKPKPKEKLYMRDIVNKSLNTLSHQAEEKGVLIETEMESGLPPVHIDPLKFPWVITNLLENAIRHTEPGGRISLYTSKSGNRIYFQCKDTGAGIEARFLPRIFTRFTQFAEGESRGSIGLGLASTKEIIEEHGGEIKVESRIGEGTIFTFWIPIGGRKET
jgi:signal transduction histidine kinase